MPPPLLFVAVLLAIVVVPYNRIILSIASIAPPCLAWLFIRLISPLKMIVDWKHVNAPPSPIVLLDGSKPFSNFDCPCTKSEVAIESIE